MKRTFNQSHIDIITELFIDCKCPTPPTGFIENMRNFGYSGISSITEMCDYLEMDLADFCLLLTHYPYAAKTFKKSRVQLKLDATSSILSIANSEITEKSLTAVLKAWEFIANNVSRTTLVADKLRVDKQDIKEKTRISRAVLKQNTERLRHAIDYDTARFTAANDEETIRRTLDSLNREPIGPSG